MKLVRHQIQLKVNTLKHFKDFHITINDIFKAVQILIASFSVTIEASSNFDSSVIVSFIHSFHIWNEQTMIHSFSFSLSFSRERSNCSNDDSNDDSEQDQSLQSSFDQHSNKWFKFDSHVSSSSSGSFFSSCYCFRYVLNHKRDWNDLSVDRRKWFYVIIMKNSFRIVCFSHLRHFMQTLKFFISQKKCNRDILKSRLQVILTHLKMNNDAFVFISQHFDWFSLITRERIFLKCLKSYKYIHRFLFIIFIDFIHLWQRHARLKDHVTW